MPGGPTPASRCRSTRPAVRDRRKPTTCCRATAGAGGRSSNPRAVAEPDREALKRAAAAYAVDEIRHGMVVGLGSGSTAEIALDLLAARRLRIVGVATSERTAQLARARGIALASLDAHPAPDLAIDGADQVERGTLDLIKGRGGALLREKIVAAAARRLVIVVDDGKLVDRLGGRTALPVEIVAFGWRSTLGRLEQVGLRPA